MILKKAIHCIKCAFTGKALIIRSTAIERMAIIFLIGLSVAIPQLLIYSIPLLLINLFLPSVQICPQCKFVEFKTTEKALEDELAFVEKQ